MKILIPLSGGLDSTTILASYVGKQHDCHTVGFHYGQRHAIELKYAEAIAKSYRVPFKLIALPELPKIDEVVFAGRNMLLAAASIACAQANKLEAVAFGCNASDWADFPDCRPPFWAAITTAAKTYDIEILTPLLHSTKHDIVAIARELDVPIHMTWSCYNPQDEEPCGACLACTTRKSAMTQAAATAWRTRLERQAQT